MLDRALRFRGNNAIVYKDCYVMLQEQFDRKLAANSVSDSTGTGTLQIGNVAFVPACSRVVKQIYDNSPVLVRLLSSIQSESKLCPFFRLFLRAIPSEIVART
jgi:hypothetical protein